MRAWSLVVAGLAFASNECPAAPTYVESIHGDLSDNRLAPTALTLAEGANDIAGTNGPSGVPDVPDLDYVAITVPAGLQISALIVVDSDVGGAVSFIGLQQGPVVTVPYDNPSPAPLLGWAHYGTADEGQDILPAIADGPGAIGFVPPLPSGTYTLWIMEIDTAFPHHYEFRIVLTPVACDAIDYNADGLFPDTADIDDFLSVFSGGACSTGACGDTDFNNDGLFPDTADIDALLSVFSGGPCV